MHGNNSVGDSVACKRVCTVLAQELMRLDVCKIYFCIAVQMLGAQMKMLMKPPKTLRLSQIVTATLMLQEAKADVCTGQEHDPYIRE